MAKTEISIPDKFIEAQTRKELKKLRKENENLKLKIHEIENLIKMNKYITDRAEDFLKSIEDLSDRYRESFGLN